MSVIVKPARTIEVMPARMAKLFRADRLPDAKQAALDYATEAGHVMNFLQILDAGLIEGNEDFWGTTVTADSSENVGLSKQGNAVMVLKHGDDIWTPERVEKAYSDGLTSSYGGKLTAEEVQGLLDGKLPDGEEFPVYRWSEIEQGAANLLASYAIVYDFAEVKDLPLGQQPIESLRSNILFVGRAGGYERANKVLNKVPQVYKGTTSYGNWHRFGEVDPRKQAEGRVLWRSDDANFGFDGLLNLNSGGRFAGVAPEAQDGARSAALDLEGQLRRILSQEVGPAHLNRVLEAVRGASMDYSAGQLAQYKTSAGQE